MPHCSTPHGSDQPSARRSPTGLRAVAFVLAGPLLAAPVSGQLAYSSAPLLPSVPYSVVADVDGDGDLDVCGREFNSPVVYPGQPDGSFGPAVGSGGPIADRDFVLGDVNGDGRADLVASHLPEADGALDVRLATENAAQAWFVEGGGTWGATHAVVGTTAP